jgi:DNA-binding response OmpR family regulator
LLAEDDIDLSDVTAFALRRQGFSVHVAYSGSQALESFNVERPDVVLLDICLPDPDGIEVLTRIRERFETPVIMITGRSDEEALVQAFSAGADDYMTKPYSFRELTMRLQAVARRAATAKASSELSVGRLAIDPDNWSVTCEGEPISLTRLEFRILHCLASHFRKVTSTERLLRFVWRDDGGDANVLKTHISHIRQKLMQGTTGLVITAVPNVGYVLNDAENAGYLSEVARSNAS